MASLPDSRHDIEARDADGRAVRLARNIARKLYRCPGCHGDIAIGDDHVLLLTPEAEDGFSHHHWHRRCAGELLVPELRKARSVPKRR
ncbi:MAG: hypothetical protein QOG09_1891 [Solirubrobacterales bacterium]|jgi:hypothetical protein|nr:hypothetical protein [Solirubrobacterales bacterium]MDX6652589.1 hypothetical protein [Solirubrobacterales bacterium]MDX6663789.1 hypothetical protein [Solirubrobacterales bacterium]